MNDGRTFASALQASPRYMIGEPILLRLTIRNEGVGAHEVLSRQAPVRGEPLNFLTVTLNDRTIPYDGRLVTFVDPADSDYVTLHAGESFSIEVDISRLYPIDVSGAYTAKLTARLDDAYAVRPGARTLGRARNQTEHEPYFLEPMSVTFEVEGTGTPRTTEGQRARSAQEERVRQYAGGITAPESDAPVVPTLIGGDETQRRQALSAHNSMLARVKRLSHLLSTTSFNANAEYKRWFGATDGPSLFTEIGIPRYRIVTNRFTDYANLDQWQFLLSKAFPITYDLTFAGCDSSTTGAHTSYGTNEICLALSTILPGAARYREDEHTHSRMVPRASQHRGH